MGNWVRGWTGWGKCTGGMGGSGQGREWWGKEMEELGGWAVGLGDMGKRGVELRVSFQVGEADEKVG